MQVFYEVIHTLHEFGYTIFDKGDYYIARDMSFNHYNTLLSLPDLKIDHPNRKSEVVISKCSDDILSDHSEQTCILTKITYSYEVRNRLDIIIKSLDSEHYHLLLAA